MAGLLDDLKAEHPSVGDVRSIGLFGIVELVKNRQTREPLAPFNGNSEPMQKLAGFLKEKGLYTYVHWHTFFTNPPLSITEAELKEGFDIINEALAITDKAVDK
jgi:taurine--2-oxoglutarate transaminase